MPISVERSLLIIVVCAACSCGNACYLLLKGSKCSEVSIWSARIYCSFRSYRFTCVEKK